MITTYNIFKANLKIVQQDKEAGKEDKEVAKHINYLLNNSKKFIIKNKRLLQNTNNKIFKRKLPYNRIFLNVSLDFKKWCVDGIFIYYHSNKLYANNPITIQDVDKILKQDEKRWIRVYYGVSNTEDNSTIFSSGGLFTDKGFNVNNIGISKKKMLWFNNQVRLFVCNFLDFINNPEVQIIEFKENKQRNIKRKKRGKLPIPTYNLIRLTGELKKHIEKMENQQSFTYSHKFWVRGHFMRFWNKNKYDNIYTKYEMGLTPKNKYYMDDQNNVLMTWLPPYIKGKGLLIDKGYKVLTK